MKEILSEKNEYTEGAPVGAALVAQEMNEIVGDMFVIKGHCFGWPTFRRGLINLEINFPHEGSFQ